MDRRAFLELSTGLLLGASMASAGARPDLRTDSRTGLAYDDAFLDHWLEPGHPESPGRFQTTMDALEQSGLLGKTARLAPLAPLDDVEAPLRRVHTAAHIASIKQRYGRSHEVAMTATAAGLAATDAVCSGRLDNAFCVTRPPGHHALNTGREEGFCFYNTVAVAARHAQAVHGLDKILIVDWDYHHGNGTEATFYDDPSVLFFSTHDHHAYPGTGDPRKTGAGKGEGFNINVHLDCGAGDDELLAAFDRTLLPAAAAFKPDLVLISAGFDSRRDDTLGCFEVSDNGFAALTKMMTTFAARHCNKRLVSVLEGGYNLAGLASSAVSHVNALLDT